MKSTIKRRDFIIKSSQVGIIGCAFMIRSKLSAIESFYKSPDDEVPDPKKLNYCSYQCLADCQFLKGSVENNDELKKEAYELWKIKERFNIDFDPEKIFCFGCKTKDKPVGVVLINCTVRECAIEKKIDCCIECDELTDCEKDLWNRFPKFKEQVVLMQKKYFELTKSK